MGLYKNRPGQIQLSAILESCSREQKSTLRFKHGSEHPKWSLLLPTKHVQQGTYTIQEALGHNGWPATPHLSPTCLYLGSFLLGASGSVKTKVYNLPGSRPSHVTLVGRFLTCRNEQIWSLKSQKCWRNQNSFFDPGFLKGQTQKLLIKAQLYWLY